jgi:hypothetical protein
VGLHERRAMPELAESSSNGRGRRRRSS